MARNPPWNRDELILALDLYYDVRPAIPAPSDSRVVALSTLLNELPSQRRATNREVFRNANGVVMKLANFRNHDPAAPGDGLRRGNHLEAEIWNEFTGRRAALRSAAKLIARSAETLTALPPLPAVDDETVFVEGLSLQRLHTYRDRKSSNAKKAQVLQTRGHLKCEACGFDFAEAYGDLGAGFAECHHLVPLASLPDQSQTRLRDLAVLCANCHRMIHRSRPMMSVSELSALVAEHRESTHQ